MIIYKSEIDTYLLSFLKKKRANLSAINTWGPDAIDKISETITRGKSVRGSLVLFAYHLTHKEHTEEVLKLAAAMELLQTALVVHDDIMDRDDMRRGIPSMRAAYKSDALAMCVGDALFFLAFELIGSLDTDAETLGRIVRFVGREYQSVCVAQMADVTPVEKTKEEIFSMYTYKTARYTFAVPLMLGAMLAGTDKEVLRYLESYGVSVGIIFQIRDDELDHTPHPFTTQDIEGFTHSAEESIVRLPIAEDRKQQFHDMLRLAKTRDI